MRYDFAMNPRPWQEIRGLRAVGTNRAVTDPDRKAVYSAALRQAEDLAKAAAAIDYAAKPLPMFYALSQAGRAITAAHHPGNWKITNHGIGVTVDQTVPLLKATVEPHTSLTGAFNAVTTATNSLPLAGATSLGSLLAANPDLAHVEIPAPEGSWLRPLSTHMSSDPPKPLPGSRRWVDGSTPYSTAGYVNVHLPIPGPVTGADVAAFLADYPTLAGAHAYTSKVAASVEPAGATDVAVRDPETGMLTVGRPAPNDITRAEQWDREKAFYSLVEVVGPDKNVGHALPSLAGGAISSPLMLWWGLLIGLSSLARYHPGLWTATIDPDSSETAIMLEQVLDVAAERVPQRIYEALSR